MNTVDHVDVSATGRRTRGAGWTAETDAADLATALAGGAFFRLRTEEEVLHAAMEILRQRDLGSGAAMIEGDTFRLTRAAHPAGQVSVVAVIERLMGKKLTEVTFPVANMPGLREALDTRQPLLMPDTRAALSALFNPWVAAAAMLVSPGKVMLLPLWVDGRPFAFLAVLGTKLRAPSTATLTLLSRHLEGALENVRHHRRAVESLEQLQRLQAELVSRERLAALGEAAAVVAHEVRNPLGAIANAVSLLRRQHDAPTEKTLLLDMIEAESRRLDDLVRDLLFLARPLVPTPRALDLGALLRNTVDGARGREPFEQLKLDVIEESGVPFLHADANHLQLAIENLLRNAAQASPPGGRIRARLSPTEMGVALEVDDQGSGVAEKDRQRIFEPFFTTRVTGTGLGLSIVRTVVKAHGGEIEVGASDLGGARFRLLLFSPTRAA